MANKDIRAIYDNGVMIWPATTTTAVVDPTSREALDVILGKKEDKPVEITECIPSRLMSINSAEDAVTLSSAEEAQLAPIIAGQNATTKFTYYSAQAIPLDISGAYAWEILGLRGFTGEVFWILKLRYIDEEVSGETVRSYWVEQEMKTPVFAEIDPTNQPTFIDVDMADLVTDNVTYPGEVWYLLSDEDDPYPESTFIDSEGRNKRIVLRIRPLEDDDYDWRIEFENPENWYFPIAIELSPLEGDYYPQSGVLHAAGTAEILRGIQLYNGILYCALIYTWEKDNNHNYYIAIHKTEMKGKISGMPAYEDVPIYPTAGDDISTAFGKINRIVQSHEEVTARALLDLNSRIQNLPSGGGGGIQEITWSALKTLRDGGNLAPGQLYRITDYTCTTAQTDTQSAGHLFDIIVLALSESTLSEIAWAEHHEGDTYFANSNLAAWKLKYCLDNNTDRFTWADTTNGKGVIYWMKDEWENECPYDFKNIQFKRWSIDTISAPSGSRVNSAGLVKLNDTFAVGNGHSINCSYRSGDYTISNLLSIETGGSLFYYTFQHIRKSGGAYDYYDLSISKDTLNSDILDFYIDDGTGVNIQNSCRHNIIEKKIYENDGEGITITYPEKQELNNIVFIGYSDYDNYENNYCTTVECSNNIIKEGGYDITILFGQGCRCNQFGTGCNSNLLGKNLTTFDNNIFGDGCYNNVLMTSNTNTFGHGSSLNVFIGENHHNMFGDSLKFNILGEGCAHNIIKFSFYNNTFGNSCSYNTFGDTCHDNTFGNSCSNNVLGNYCYNNTFGNSCSNNVLGNYCYYNTFIYNSSSYNKVGSGCSYIKRAGTNPITQLKNCEIGEGCSNIVFSPSYFKNITIEQGIKYLQMSPGGGTTSSDIYQNYRFCSGIEGTSSNWKFITLPSANNNFLTTYKPANSVEISV